jgi:hypothetical protein
MFIQQISLFYQLYKCLTYTPPVKEDENEVKITSLANAHLSNDHSIATSNVESQHNINFISDEKRNSLDDSSLSINNIHAFATRSLDPNSASNSERIIPFREEKRNSLDGSDIFISPLENNADGYPALLTELPSALFQSLFGKMHTWPELETMYKVNKLLRKKINSSFIKEYIESSVEATSYQQIDALKFVKIINKLAFLSNLPTKIKIPICCNKESKKIPLMHVGHSLFANQVKSNWSLIEVDNTIFISGNYDYNFGGKYLSKLNFGQSVAYNDDIISFLNRSPNLKFLRFSIQTRQEISAIHHLKELRELTINFDPKNAFSSVKTITIDSDSLKSLAQILPQLEKVRFEIPLSNDQWKTIFKEKTQLIELDLRNNAIDEETLLTIAKACPSLQKMIIPDFEHRENEEVLLHIITVLEKLCPELNEIHIGSLGINLSLKFTTEEDDRIREIQYKGISFKICCF